MGITTSKPSEPTTYNVKETFEIQAKSNNKKINEIFNSKRLQLAHLIEDDPNLCVMYDYYSNKKLLNCSGGNKVDNTNIIMYNNDDRLFNQPNENEKFYFNKDNGNIWTLDKHKKLLYVCYNGNKDGNKIFLSSAQTHVIVWDIRRPTYKISPSVDIGITTDLYLVRFGKDAAAGVKVAYIYYQEATGKKKLLTLQKPGYNNSIAKFEDQVQDKDQDIFFNDRQQEIWDALHPGSNDGYYYLCYNNKKKTLYTSDIATDRIKWTFRLATFE